MADKVVVEKLLIFVVEKILKRAQSLLTDEILHSWNIVQLELNQIQGSLAAILSVLQDAGDSTLVGLCQPKPFSLWLEKLKDAAYEADDVLDDLAYHNLQRKVSYSNRIFQSIDFLKKSELALKVKTLNESLHEIRDEATVFRFYFRCSDDKLIHVDLDRLMDLEMEDVVVSRETDVSKIVASLLSSSSDEQISFPSSSRNEQISSLSLSSDEQILRVVPIVGINVLGKTTLAKMVGERVMARKLFDLTVWLCCSGTSLEDLFEIFLRKMLLSLGRTAKCLTDKDTIVELLRKELVSRKCLLVLDNLWIGDSLWWHDFVTRFLGVCSNNENAILVTCSEEGVALIVDPSSKHWHKLDFLSDDECWSIMKERAFRNAKMQIPSSLEQIGRKIAKYCRGVPLVAKVLGGTMGFNMDEESWLRIRDRISWLDNRQSDNLLLRLALSFDQLPLGLKLSFTFLLDSQNVFLARKEELIQLWVVEGFADSCDQGDKYFSTLLENSFFHYEEKSDDCNDIRFQMLDYLPYFASELVKPVIRCQIIPPAVHTFSGRHMHVDYKHSEFKVPSDCLDIAFQDLRKLKSLRALNIHGNDIEELPSPVGKLRHLRYLSASDTKIRALPKSFTKLYHLQSLNISNSCIKSLPDSISKLHNLQNLNVSNTKIKELPGSIGKLENLQSLNISNSSIKELPESIVMLQNLKTLNASNSNIVVLPEFVSKLENLETLDVSYCSIKEFPESITNLCKLQMLKFFECKELSTFPKKAMNRLTNLKNISFSYEHQMPFGLGHLTSLQTLPFFVVGPDFGGCVGELEFLNELRGHLEITRLEEVQDKEEAKRANLRG